MCREEVRGRRYAIVALVCLLISGDLTACDRNKKPPLTPDYALRETEKNAETIGDDDGGKPETPNGGGSVSLLYAKEVSIDLSEKKAALVFGNPAKSNQNMMVQLVIRDEILLQSGLIAPGNQVRTLDLLDGAEQKLRAGGYDGHLVVLYYHPETGEKSIMNTKISVMVTVAE